MDLETIAWSAAGWLGVAAVISLLLGGFLGMSNVATREQDIENMAERERVIRYIRKPRAKVAARPAATPSNHSVRRRHRR